MHVNSLDSYGSPKPLSYSLKPIWTTFVVESASSTEGGEDIDGSSVDEEPLIQSLLMKSLTAVGITSVQSHAGMSSNSIASDTDDKDEVQTEAQADVFDGNLENDPEKRCDDGEESINVRATLKNQTKRQSKKMFSKKRIGSSDPYFIALFWLFILSQLWFHFWLLQLVPVLVLVYFAKMLFLCLNVAEVIPRRCANMIGRCEQWTFKRKDAIVPVPIRGIYKLMLKGDKKVCKIH